MMIRFIRSGQVVHGKYAEAALWAKQMTELLNKNYPETKVHLLESRFGQLGRMEWHLDFDDLAALDEYQGRLGSDEEYQEHARAGVELFVAGSFGDNVLRSV